MDWRRSEWEVSYVIAGSLTRRGEERFSDGPKAYRTSIGLNRASSWEVERLLHQSWGSPNLSRSGGSNLALLDSSGSMRTRCHSDLARCSVQTARLPTPPPGLLPVSRGVNLTPWSEASDRGSLGPPHLLG